MFHNALIKIDDKNFKAYLYTYIKENVRVKICSFLIREAKWIGIKLLKFKFPQGLHACFRGKSVRG